MARRIATILVLTGALLGVAVATAGAASARTTLATVRVRPALAGVPVVLHGHTYRTDARGQVQVPATPAELADRGILLRDRLTVPTASLGPGLRVRFVRWVGRTASIELLRPIRPVLVDPSGARVATRLAPKVIVRGTDGSRLTLRSGAVAWLPAVRAVARPGRQWRQRRVSYSVQEVPVHGSNVVHRAQQRFVPNGQSQVTVRVLFFTVRFAARDALFGSPIGNGFVLRFPDGHTERHVFGKNAEQVVEGLPRGDYTVTVDAPGMGFSRPLALSRSQVVDLRIISWLDLALGAALLLLGLFGLEVWRQARKRRTLRGRLHTAVARPGAEGGGD